LSEQEQGSPSFSLADRPGLSVPDRPELLTLPIAAREAGVGVRQLRRAVAQGKVPVFLIGRWSRVRWRDVLRWIERQRVPATPHAERRVAEILAREARGE
jgi:hypothetical protein